MSAAKGIDIFNSGATCLPLLVSLKAAADGTPLAAATTSISLLELQDDGSFKTFDWWTSTFKTSGMTTGYSVGIMAQQARIGDSDATVNTGIWSIVVGTVTGFTVGKTYVLQVANTLASPPNQERMFQYGGVAGDTATVVLQANVQTILNAVPGSLLSDAYATNANMAALVTTINDGTTGLPGILGVVQVIPNTTKWTNHTLAVDVQTLKINGNAGYLSQNPYGGKGGPPILDATTGLILTGYLGGGVTVGTVTTVTGGATSANQTTLLNAINALQSLSARSGPVIPAYLARPTSGSVTYKIELRLWNLAGAAEDADSNTVTIAARDASGNSHNGQLGSTTMTRTAIGHYTVTYTVASSDPQEEVFFDFIWAVNAVAMKDGGVTEVQDAENWTALAALTATVGTPAGASIAADIAAAKAYLASGSALTSVAGSLNAAIANAPDNSSMAENVLVMMGDEFNGNTDSLHKQRAAIDALSGGSGGGGTTGDGDTPVDHNTGGTDHLRYGVGDVGQDNVVIRAYLTSDYAAGTRDIKAKAITGPDGRWLEPMMLNAGVSYTLVADVPGMTQAIATVITP